VDDPADDDVVARLRAAGCVFAEDEAAVLRAEARDATHLGAMVADRVAGRPLEQIVGWVGFCGLRIRLVPGVFVPRRRSEHLAHLVVDLVRGADRPVVVELCCGAAAIGAAVLDRVDDVELVVADIDPAAVAAARRNVGRRALVLHGDLDAPLPTRLRGRVDVLVANAPYVPTDAVAHMPPEARDHEPLVALDGGADGLDVARRLVNLSGGWLRPGGRLVIETSVRQAPALLAAFSAAGLDARVSRDEDRDATAVVGRRVVSA
jgi:release factor glutamine methyltransferase